MAAEFEPYGDAIGEFRWRLVASNGETIATGGEVCQSRTSAKAAMEYIKKNAPQEPVEGNHRRRMAPGIL